MLEEMLAVDVKRQINQGALQFYFARKSCFNLGRVQGICIILVPTCNLAKYMNNIPIYYINLLILTDIY